MFVARLPRNNQDVMRATIRTRMAPGRLTDGWRSPIVVRLPPAAPRRLKLVGAAGTPPRKPTQRQRGEDRQPRVAYAALAKEKAVGEQIAWGTRRGAG